MTDYSLCKTLLVTESNVLDDSAESVADRELLRALAQRDVPCEAVGRFIVPGDQDVEVGAWLASREWATRDDDGEGSAVRVRAAGVPVALFRGASTRQQTLDDDERVRFLQLIEATLDRTRPTVVLARFGPSLATVLTAARARGIVAVAYHPDLTIRDAASLRDADVVLAPTRFAAHYIREAFGLPCADLPAIAVGTPVEKAPHAGSVVFDATTPGGCVPVFAQIATELCRLRPGLPVTIIGGTGEIPMPGGGKARCVPLTEAASAWASARVCLAPIASWEQTPHGVLSALAHGVPVVASDRGSLPELLAGVGTVVPLPDRVTMAFPDRLQSSELAPWVDAVRKHLDDPKCAARQREQTALAGFRHKADEVVPRYAEFLMGLATVRPKAGHAKAFNGNGTAHHDDRPAVHRLAESSRWPEERPDDAAPGQEQGWLGAGSEVILARSLSSKTKLVVELGAWLGLSTRYIAEHAPHATVVSVDHWQGSPEHQTQDQFRALLPRLYETFQARCWDYRERVVPLRTGTLDGLKRVADAGLQPDFVYVDAEHSYEAVSAELKLARSLFPKARLGGDDYDWTGVRMAVDEFAREHGLLVDRAGARGWRLLEQWQAGELGSIPAGRGQMVALVPHMNGIDWECEQALRQLEHAGVRVVRRGGCSAIDVARNAMVSEALHDGAESMMFIDSDIGFEPAEALRLFARPEPVVSGVYPKKGMRELASIFADGVKELQFGPDAVGAYPLKYAATGFLRIKSETLRQMVDRLKLPLCDTHWGRGVWPFFQPVVVPHGPGKYHYLAEDWAFSYRLSQMGVTPIADTSVRLWHWGRYGYGWEDAGSTPARYRSYTYRLAST